MVSRNESAQDDKDDEEDGDEEDEQGATVFHQVYDIYSSESGT